MKVAILSVLLVSFAAAVACARPREILAPLNQAVNAMLGAAGAANRETSRVVPVESAGGLVAGYAQIIGPRMQVLATRAVIKVSVIAPNGWKIDALIPVSSVSRSGVSMHREYGVAIDAIANRSL